MDYISAWNLQKDEVFQKVVCAKTVQREIVFTAWYTLNVCD